MLVFVLGAAREWWRGERERRGLLRLLLAEIYHNAEVTETISGRLRRGGTVADLIGHPDLSSLKARTWANVQIRAAALLPGDLLGTVQRYYSPLEALLTLADFTNASSDALDRVLRSQIQEQRPDWTVAATRNPYQEQVEQFLEAQELAPAKIEAYLARPLWEPLVLASLPGSKDRDEPTQDGR